MMSIKTLAFIINIIYITFISCSYLSKSIDRRIINNNINVTNTTELTELKISRSDSLNERKSYTSSKKKNFASLNLQKDIEYIGNIYIGTPRKKMTVSFDTALNVSWLPYIECENCKLNTERYSPYSSRSEKYLYEIKNISKPYTSGFVEGFVYKETISINYEGKSFFGYPLYRLTSDYFKFVSVYNEVNLEERISDGVIGLGINNEKDYYYSIIRISNEINYPSFSFYILENKNIYRLYFGDILCNYYVYNLFENHIQECQVKQDALYWECNPSSGVKLISSNKTYNDTIFQTNSSVIFDSGISNTIIPNNDFMKIFNFLSLGHNCTIDINGQILCKCLNKDEFGRMELNFDDYNKFMIFFNNNIEYNINNGFQCLFKIKKGILNDTWILGESVFKGNLINFSMKDRKISFVQNITQIIQNNKIKKSHWFSKTMSFLKYLLLIIAISVVIIIIIIIFVIYITS